MSQQINLYSPRFRKQKKVFSARAMAQALALVLAVVGGFYAYVALQGSLLEIRAADSGQRLRSELERLKVLSARGSPAARAAQLAERRKELQAQLAERTRAMHAMGEGLPGRAEGYSPFLRALARVSMDGLWLTRIQFSAHEGEATLGGRATRAELVAVYLERLRAEAALRGQAFASLRIERLPAGGGQGPLVEFVLSSSAPEEPEGRRP